MVVARDASEPLWLLAYRVLRDEIATGRLPAGRHLPSERALGSRLDVSRITLRRALRELADQRLIEPSPGRGWQVSSPRMGEPANALVSFSALGEARGLRPGSRVLHRALRAATLDEAERLRVAPGSRVLDVERLRLLDDVPIAVNRFLVALSRAPGIDGVDFERASLYATLEQRCGAVPVRAECSAEAAGADPRRAELLGLRAGQPVMVVDETVLDQSGQVLVVGEVVYRGDRYRLETTLLRPGHA